MLVTLTSDQQQYLSLQTGGSFSDTLANMSAVTGAVGGTCAGTTPMTLGAGATALSFTGIIIPASGNCTVTFSVRSTNVAVNNNQTSGVSVALSSTVAVMRRSTSAGAQAHITFAT